VHMCFPNGTRRALSSIQWARGRFCCNAASVFSGVGALTALCYALVVEDPTRFRNSRSAGAYLGLVPALEDSGDYRSELGISKTGHTLCRRLLVQGAQYILGPFGPDTDLRRWGLSLASHSRARKAKKRAVVAVARKLAVLLHRLWVSGERYEPLRARRPAA